MGFHDVENRAWKELVPGVRVRTFWGEEMLVAHVAVDEKAIVPLHSHPHEQGGMVISGEMEFIVDGITRVVKAGESYIIPGNVEHQAIGLKNSQLFEIFCPVREEYKF